MILFGPSHLSAIGVIVVTSIVIAFTVRQSRKAERSISRVLAILLLLNWLLCFFWGYPASGLRNNLPMHLCDWTAIAAIIGLLWHQQLPFEMTYFWGLGGTLQAILTPDLPYDFPDLRFITFFVSHGCVIVAIALFTLGLRVRPWSSSIMRIFMWSNIYLGSALAVNQVLGTNYGYLCHKPAHPSLLDYLGPWPFYILSLEGAALLSFAISYVPFLLMDLLAKRPAKN